jgi:hypothetical protein
LKLPGGYAVIMRPQPKMSVKRKKRNRTEALSDGFKPTGLLKEETKLTRAKTSINPTTRITQVTLKKQAQ